MQRVQCVGMHGADAARWHGSPPPPVAGLTKIISKLSKGGACAKALEVFELLPQLGLTPDTAITNSAISACDKGGCRGLS
jgi:hypothetical protein